MNIFTKRFYCLTGLIMTTVWTISCLAQSRNPAVDSMGMNMGRQNWKAALHWALQAAEANPSEKYWRYLNAADFASRDKNLELTIRYASLVADSDIASRAGFGKSFDWLRDEPRWKEIMEKVELAREKERRERIQASLPFRQYQQELLAASDERVAALADIASATALYQEMRQNRPVHQYSRSGKYQYAWLKFADSLDVPYLVQLPVHFDANKTYPLLVVLHGAVMQQTIMRDVADSAATFFGRSFMENACESGMIAVFPYSTRRVNWMMPDDGFDLVPEIIRAVKHMYSIDDSRVYVSGHSNGATGAFSYLMKQPSLFAGFSGVNNRPQVRTGGTFFKNASNRSFYNVATDFDYYFPLEGHRAVTDLARQLGINWQNVEVTGKRSHGYLIMSRDSLAKKVYQELFTDMISKKRNPFQPQLYWESDDVKNGRCDWIEISQLDTLSEKADWHKPVNRSVDHWRDVNDPAIVLDSTSQAFVFPRQSGAVQASYAKNQFDLKTSRVGEITIYLSPEMVDLNAPIQVQINGKPVYSGLVQADRQFLLDQYKKEMDHQALWVNKLKLSISR